MKIKIIFLVIILITLGAILWYGNATAPHGNSPESPTGYKNTSYNIGGTNVTLENGHAETPAAPGSASKTVTEYFGNEIRKDLNDDGREDVVFLLTQNSGGTGTFFYVVAAVATDNGYVGSKAFPLGDRIAPQTTESGNGKVVIVNYADRRPNEPMTTQPSVGKSASLVLDAQTLEWGVVETDFEGEADPSKMTLTMKTWNWIKALYNNGQQIVPQDSKRFTLTFLPEGRFTATTDCNSIIGNYEVKKNAISFEQTATTQRYCKGSQEREFAGLLADSASYHFTSKGELILDLKFDSGSVIFR